MKDGICALCGYVYAAHGVGISCEKFRRVKKRKELLRLILCPFGVHPKRAMIPLGRSLDRDGYYCRRCDREFWFDAGGELAYMRRRGAAVGDAR